MLGYYFDPTMIILIPGVILAAIAQFKVSANFARYSEVRSSRGLTGATVAKALLEYSGIRDVSVEHIRGKLSDHYDPRSKVVRLSDSVYDSTSIAAISVAAHEVGHAIQHNKGYFPLDLRTTILPLANIGSNLSWIFIMIGLFMSSGGTLMMQIGILLFSFGVLFQIVTLPVEFNASDRAIKLLQQHNFLQQNEVKGAKSVLGAAALTYVAATLSAVLSLVRLLIIANSRND